MLIGGFARILHPPHILIARAHFWIAHRPFSIVKKPLPAFLTHPIRCDDSPSRCAGCIFRSRNRFPTSRDVWRNKYRALVTPQTPLVGCRRCAIRFQLRDYFWLFLILNFSGMSCFNPVLFLRIVIRIITLLSRWVAFLMLLGGIPDDQITHQVICAYGGYFM